MRSDGCGADVGLHGEDENWKQRPPRKKKALTRLMRLMKTRAMTNRKKEVAVDVHRACPSSQTNGVAMRPPPRDAASRNLRARRHPVETEAVSVRPPPLREDSQETEEGLRKQYQRATN